ncbi:MAG: dihydrofolate reductase [Patescibacteria group bacterium]
MKKIKYILLAAISLDGKIAQSKKQASNWTSLEDKKHLKNVLDKCDVCIIGNNTYKISQKALAKRNCIVLTKKIKDIKVSNNNCAYINPQKLNVQKYIKQKQYSIICILGGTQVYNWALENNFIDEMYLTIEPVIFGQGLSLIDLKLINPAKFKIFQVKKLNPAGSLLLKLVK